VMTLRHFISFYLLCLTTKAHKWSLFYPFTNMILLVFITAVTFKMGKNLFFGWRWTMDYIHGSGNFFTF